MKVIYCFLLTICLISIGCEEDKDAGADLRLKLTSGQWTVIKIASPVVGGAYLTISSWNRQEFTFNNDGHYSVVYYRIPTDTIFIEGAWTIKDKPFGVDFLACDTIHHTNENEDISNLRTPPADWKVESSDDTLQVQLIFGDTLTDYHYILVK